MGDTEQIRNTLGAVLVGGFMCGVYVYVYRAHFKCDNNSTCLLQIDRSSVDASGAVLPPLPDRCSGNQKTG